MDAVRVSRCRPVVAPETRMGRMGERLRVWLARRAWSLTSRRFTISREAWVLIRVGPVVRTRATFDPRSTEYAVLWMIGLGDLRRTIRNYTVGVTTGKLHLAGRLWVSEDDAAASVR